MVFYTPPLQTGSFDPAVDVTNLTVGLSEAASSQTQRAFGIEGLSSIYKSWELGNIRERQLKEQFEDEILYNDARTIGRITNPFFFVADYALELADPTFVQKVRDGDVDFTQPEFQKYLRPGTEILSFEEANREGEVIGLTDFKNPVSRAEFTYLSELKIKENRLNSRISRARQQFGTGTVLFASALAGAAADPVNLASAFIPVMGQARWAKLVGSVVNRGVLNKVLASKTISRFSTGAINAFVGNLAIEPIILANAKELQADYTAADSLMNLTLGSLIGGGLHFGIGIIRDVNGRAASSNRRDGKAMDPEYEFDLNHGYARQMEMLALPSERNAAMASAVDNLIEGKIIDVEYVVKTSNHISTPKVIDIEDIPLGIKVKNLPDGRVEVSFENQPKDFSVDKQLGENLDDASSKLISRFIKEKRGFTEGSTFLRTNFKKVPNTTGVYESGGWRITKDKKQWVLTDNDGRVHSKHRTLTVAKEANQFLPDKSVSGDIKEFSSKQQQAKVAAEGLSQLQKMTGDYTNLKSAKAMNAKLKQLGYPLDRFKKTSSEIIQRKTKGRDKLISKATTPKGRAALEAHDAKTSKMEAELNLEKQLADDNIATRARSELIMEQGVLRREIEELSQQLGGQRTKQKPKPTESELEAEARGVHENRDWLDDPEAVAQMREEAKTTEKFIGELEKQHKEIIEDTKIIIDRTRILVETLDIEKSELSIIDDIAQGGDALILGGEIPIRKTPTATVNAVVLNSFDDINIDSIAKESGFSDMADFRSQVMTNPDKFKEVELHKDLKVSIKDTLDRQRDIQDAMDRGATDTDIIEAVKKGDDLREVIPENQYDVDISKAKASGQLIRDYINCRKL